MHSQYVAYLICLLSWDGRFSGMKEAVAQLADNSGEDDSDVQQRWNTCRATKTRTISVAESFVAFDASHQCNDCQWRRDDFPHVNVEIRSIPHDEGALLETDVGSVQASSDQFVKDAKTRRTIMHISYRQRNDNDAQTAPVPAPELALLNYHHALGKNRNGFQQVIVVRGEHFEQYCQVWASVKNRRYIVALPRKMRSYLEDNEWVPLNESGSGYARAFCQLLAHGLGLSDVHMWDDNVREVRELYVADDQGGHPLRADDAADLKAERRLVPFSRAMRYFEDMYNKDRAQLMKDQGLTMDGLLRPDVSFKAENKDSPDVPFREIADCVVNVQRPLTKKDDGEWRCIKTQEEFFLARDQCAITGMHRDILNFAHCKPFNRTHSVYSAFLLHNDNVLRKGIVYPLRKKVWEVCNISDSGYVF